jgi:serine/threonine-protein kinase
MEKIGRYEIIRELGRGGMASVYLARDPSFEREVAIKVLPLHFMHDSQFLARFRREARIIAALEHPYIVPVYDYGEEGEQPFIVMRYMTGGTLAEHMGGKPISLAEVIPIVQRLAEALDEAHSRNIVHRDLKPANVMFDARGNAFLSDFGIAKLLEGTSALTGSGVVGTPAYMSPEQAVGDNVVDGRSDVYALGIIVYEMLAGHHPYEADTPVKVMFKHITEPVPHLDTAPLGLPKVSNAILGRVLAKKPEERYATAGAFVRALSALVTAPIRSPAASVSPSVSPAPHGAVAPPTKSFPDALPPKPAEPSLLTYPAPGPASARVAVGRSPPTRTAPTWRLSPRLLGFSLAGLIVFGGLVGLVVFVNIIGGGGGEQPTSTATATNASEPTFAPATTEAPPTIEPSPTATLRPSPTPITPSPTPRPPTLTSPPPTATPTASVPPTATATAAATRRAPTRTPTRQPSTATQLPATSLPTSPPPIDTNPPPPPPSDTPVVGPPPTNTPVPAEATNTPVP